MTAFRVIRDILVALASLCVIAWTIFALLLGARIGHAIDQVNQPTPETTVTGCPFGPDNCGG